MMRVSALLLLAKLAVSEGAGYSYDLTHETSGPFNWGDIEGSFCDAASHEQTPIDLCGAKHASFLELGAQDTWEYKGGLKVLNNGHTIQVNFDPKANPPTTINDFAVKVGRASTGKIKWQVQQVHFHWGTATSPGGSEHYLSGKQYTMEAHFVHFNADKYNDVTDAVKSGDSEALLVIGVFLSLSESESAFVTSIGNVIHEIDGNPVDLKLSADDFSKFARANILNENAIYNIYAGGLTTPTCNEVVTWVVMEQSCKVTEATLMKFMMASTNPKIFRLRRGLGGDELISKFGNFRPLSLNKNTVHTNHAQAQSTAKCAFAYNDAKAWHMTRGNCPSWAAHFTAICPLGPDSCTRESNKEENSKICAEFTNNEKCMNDANAKAHLSEGCPYIMTFANCPVWEGIHIATSGKDVDVTRAQMMAMCMEFKNNDKCAKDALAQKTFGETCPKFEWRVMYEDCDKGYWASGCGQPATKQMGVAQCYGWTGVPAKSWVDKDEMCSGKKPTVADKVCPATMPCPRCKGCIRDGGCWKVCGKKAGPCSACDSRDGRMGACCQRGNSKDPVACQVAEFQFATDKVHTCAVLPADMHLGGLLMDIVSRVNYLEHYSHDPDHSYYS